MTIFQAPTNTLTLAVKDYAICDIELDNIHHRRSRAYGYLSPNLTSRILCGVDSNIGVSTRLNLLNLIVVYLLRSEALVLGRCRINSIIPIIKAIISEALRAPGNSGTTTYPVATPLRVKSGV